MSTEKNALSPQKEEPSLRPGAKGGVRDKNRKEKRHTLRDAAIGLFLDKGIESTTIDDITKKAAVAKGSFYRYFEDKEQLVRHLLAPLIGDLENAFDRCRKGLEDTHTAERMMDVYRDLGAELTRVLLERSHVVKIYLQESRAPRVGARIPVCEAAELLTDHAITLTHVAHRHGLLRPLPAEISALAVLGASERLLLAVFAEEDIGDPLVAPETLASLILHGLLREPKGDEDDKK